MSFVSLEFIIFVLLTAAFLWILPFRARPATLAATSFAYCLTWNLALAVSLLIIPCIAWMGVRPFAKWPESLSKRAYVSLLVLVLLIPLLLAKLPPSAFTRPGLESLSIIVLPVGVSYFTFKMISFVLDVYWERLPESVGLLDFVTYAAFFPQLVSGPIQRVEPFLASLHRESASAPDSRGLRRILLGVFKKLVIADQLRLLVLRVFLRPQELDGIILLLAGYAFALELYFDFSGLCDIAIGVAALLGIDSPENFIQPFSAPNIQEFWRRWHITLTTWLTDYVFLPLRMATRTWGALGLYLSIACNMLLIGLWHGIGMTFLCFGAFHGILMVLYTGSARWRRQISRRYPELMKALIPAGVVLTFHCVVFSFVIFRASSLWDVWHIVSHALPPHFNEAFHFTLKAFTGGRRLAVTMVCLILVLVYENPIMRRRLGESRLNRTSLRWCAYYAAAILIWSAWPGVIGTNFIYQRF